MAATAQEKLALGVTALLLAAGVGGRALFREAPVHDSGAEAAAASPIGRTEAEVAKAAVRARPLAPGERLDPNTASVDELVRLPKVGPAMAESIVQARDRRRFRTLADLDSVAGVGPAVLTAVAPHVALAPAPRAAPKAARAAGLAPVADRPEIGSRVGAPAAALDLNTATEAELERLPGVGPALARRIVQSRQRDGRFRSVQELERVSGIGASAVARLAPLVRASP